MEDKDPNSNQRFFGYNTDVLRKTDETEVSMTETEPTRFWEHPTPIMGAVVEKGLGSL